MVSHIQNKNLFLNKKL